MMKNCWRSMAHAGYIAKPLFARVPAVALSYLVFLSIILSIIKNGLHGGADLISRGRRR